MARAPRRPHRRDMSACYIEVLPPALANTYAYLNGCFVHADGPPPDATELTNAVATQAGVYMAGFGLCDRRAAASMWWQYYASFLLPPLAVLAVTAPERTPISVWPRFAASGLVEKFEVHRFGAHDDWFARLLAENLVPVVDTLRRFSGVSRRVLWTNAASRLAALCDHLATLPAPYREAAGHGRALLGRPMDGSVHSLGSLLQNGAPRVCCLRYRLPGFVTCGNCPLEGGRARVDRMESRRDA